MTTDAIRKYHTLFNEVGKDYELSWGKDTNKNGKPDLNEMIVTPQFEAEHQWQQLSQPQKNALLFRSILTIFVKVEQRQTQPSWIAQIPVPNKKCFLVFPPQTQHEEQILHENSHALGPTEKKLGTDLYYKLHDIEDIIRVALISAEMAGRTQLAQEQKKAAYLSTVLNPIGLIESLKAKGVKVILLEETGTSAREAILGYYFYTGVVTLDENSHIRVDFEKIQTAMENLLQETSSALKEGSQNKAKAVLDYERHIPQEWFQKIYNLLQK